MEHRHPTRENAEGCSSQTCPGGPPACSRLVLLSILECELKMQNKTLSIICLKLRRDILHSQNKTHAPSTVSGVLCDLLPLVHVTSSPSAYLSFPQLCSNKTSPPHPGAMVLGEAVVGASVRTTLPGSQHQRQWLSVSKSPSPEALTNLVSVLPVTQLSSWILSLTSCPPLAQCLAHSRHLINTCG